MCYTEIMCNLANLGLPHQTKYSSGIGQMSKNELDLTAYLDLQYLHLEKMVGEAPPANDAVPSIKYDWDEVKMYPHKIFYIYLKTLPQKMWTGCLKPMKPLIQWKCHSVS